MSASDASSHRSFQRERVGVTATLPLPGLVALDTPRLACLLLAVEPRLRGVVFAGAAGTGKSALARGLRSLRPEAPWIPLPLGADDEALLGGLDIDATLRTGRRVVKPGVLARAHGGVLAIESLELLADSATNLLLGALDDGEVRVERDGVSERAPALFTLVGSYAPAEGTPRPHLLDRIGLIVLVPPVAAAAARAEIVRRNIAGSPARWADELDSLRSLCEVARANLATVRITPKQQRELIAAAVAFGVQGQRADYFALLVARAAAALGLRDAVEREDLELAVRLVLLPRATQRPAPPAQEPAASDVPQQTPTDGESADEGDQSSDAPQPVEELFEAVVVELPNALDTLPFAPQRRGRSGSRGATSGRRGRHVGSVPGDPAGERLDLAATLRAAARWQRVRRREGTRVALRAEDLRVKRFQSKAGTLFLFAVDASGSMALNRMREAKGAVYALLEQAYVHRDQVALITFRGNEAVQQLPPTASVELVRRAVDLLRTGGGTPVAATLLRSLEIADRARRRGTHNIVLVLLTDGRANVGLRAAREDVDTEVQKLAAGVARAGVRSLVVDTQRGFTNQGTASRLAGWLGGTYLYLPGAGGQTIAAAARDATTRKERSSSSRS
jgi:magnesium chelatase subunit D